MVIIILTCYRRVQIACVCNKYVLSMFLQQEACFLLVLVSSFHRVYQYLSLFYANLDKLFCSVFYFVTNITHLFHIIKYTLHVIIGAYIVLMQNSFNVQF